MILSKNMLNRVGDRRQPWRIPVVVQNHYPRVSLIRTALVALSYRCSMAWIRLTPMLYFLMVAHKAACYTLSNAYLKSIKTW